MKVIIVGGVAGGATAAARIRRMKPDDLKKLDDENVYRKLQGHWIIEM